MQVHNNPTHLPLSPGANAQLGHTCTPSPTISSKPVAHISVPVPFPPAFPSIPNLYSKPTARISVLPAAKAAAVP